MLNTIKGIGFDLDGTLVDSVPGLASAIDATLHSAGLPSAGEQRVSTWIGNGTVILVERALKWAGKTPTPSELELYHSTFEHHYIDTIEHGTRLYSGVIETLEILHQHHIKIALVTNKPSRFVPSLLTQLGIAHYFSAIVGGDDVVVKKPHPAPIYLILGQLGLKPDELLFVGDSRNDIEAAKAAHCQTVGLTYGYNYGESIAQSQPDYVLDNFTDILPLVGLATGINTK